MSFAETPDLDCSSVSESPNKEKEDDVASSMIRKRELLTGAESDCEIWCVRTNL